MRWRVVGVGLISLIAMVALFALRPPVIDRLELNLLDWRFRLRGPIEPEIPIAIIAIDARSLDEFGRWPWRRSVIAQLIDRLSAVGVIAIGVDVVFAEPETPPEIEPLRAVLQTLTADRKGSGPVVAALDKAIAAADTDVLLEHSIAESNRTVLGFFFRTGIGEGLARSPEELEQEARRVRRSRYIVRGEPPEGLSAPLLTCEDVEPSLDAFNQAARRMGFVNAIKDADGAVRRAALVASCAGGLYPSLSVATLEVALGRRAMVVWGPHGLEAIRLGDLVIPVDEGGRTLVNYLGPAQTFPHYSAADVALGRIDDAKLEGHIVLLGPTEIGMRDTHATPFNRAAPGVEVHATLLHNFLTGEVLRQSDSLVLAELGAMVVSGLLMAFLVPILGSALRGALFAILILGGMVGGSVYAFIEHGIWLNLAYPGLTVVVVYLTVAVTQSATEEAQARWIRQTFATFVPPDVVAEMIERPDSFVVGGQRKDLSLLFSDIRGFTTISEDLGAEDTTSLLNQYLTPMTEIVFGSRGTLDKYIGDAVVAFWGAPLPVTDHPLHAAQAALAMQEAVRDMRENRQDLRGASRLQIGIGIHSAEVNVGMMGSALRFDYTVTGDGVNLCARLESLTKQYGAEILTSQDLVKRLPPGFLLRELDSIRVKGKRDAVLVFELLGEREAKSEEKTWLEAYAAGLREYRSGNWAAAEAALVQARETAPRAEKACDLLLDRIAVFKVNEPRDWEGIWTFETK